MFQCLIDMFSHFSIFDGTAGSERTTFTWTWTCDKGGSVGNMIHLLHFHMSFLQTYTCVLHRAAETCFCLLDDLIGNSQQRTAPCEESCAAVSGLGVCVRKNVSETSSLHFWRRMVVCVCGAHSSTDPISYHSTGNQFERFRGFLELISRFEFEFCRRENFFLNDSNFWCVQSSNTHNVAVHVHVLWPVCAHAIPLRMLWLP